MKPLYRSARAWRGDTCKLNSTLSQATSSTLFETTNSIPDIDLRRDWHGVISRCLAPRSLSGRRESLAWQGSLNPVGTVGGGYVYPWSYQHKDRYSSHMDPRDRSSLAMSVHRLSSPIWVENLWSFPPHCLNLLRLKCPESDRGICSSRPDDKPDTASGLARYRSSISVYIVHAPEPKGCGRAAFPWLRYLLCEPRGDGCLAESWHYDAGYYSLSLKLILFTSYWDVHSTLTSLRNEALQVFPPTFVPNPSAIL